MRNGRGLGLLCLIVAAGLVAQTAQAQVFIDRQGNLGWAREHCEDSEECKIEIEVADGKRVVIVNGDTVDVEEMNSYAMLLDDYQPMIERLHGGPLIWEGPGGRGYAFFGGNAGIDRHRMHHPRRIDFGMDKELRKLERDARKLARNVRRADDDERAELESEFDRKLTEIFNYKGAKRQEAIDRAEDRLADMRERQQKRESAKAGIIDQRKRDLLGEQSYLEW